MNSVIILFLSLLAAIAGVASAYGGVSLSWLTIALVDAYLFLVLLFSAILCDMDGNRANQRAIQEIFSPTRTEGLFVALLLSVALVTSFAGLNPRPEMATAFTKPIDGRLDACYVSIVTMTTVGFGDFTPVTLQAKRIVIAQIASGALLFFGIFPLLVSRLSTFK